MGRFTCPSCNEVTDLSYGALSVTCTCRSTFDFVNCPKCGAAQPMLRIGSTRCRWCDTALRSWRALAASPFSRLIGVDPTASDYLLGNGETPT